MSHGAPRTNTGWMGEWKQEKINGFTILWSVELVDWLNDTAARPDITIKWLTTWQDEAANVFSGPVGLAGATWPYFIADNQLDLRDMEHWWKLAIIKRDLRRTRPSKAVWLDDDIKFDGYARNWVKEEEPNILAISPNSHHGLTKKDTIRIEEYLAD